MSIPTTMTLADVLTACQVRGITLKAEGGRILYHPVDAVDLELFAALKAHKAALLEHLTAPAPRPIPIVHNPHPARRAPHPSDTEFACKVDPRHPDAEWGYVPRVRRLMCRTCHPGLFADAEPAPITQPAPTVPAAPSPTAQARRNLLAWGTANGFPRLALAYGDGPSTGPSRPFLWVSSGEDAWRRFTAGASGRDVQRATLAAGIAAPVQGEEGA